MKDSDKNDSKSAMRTGLLPVVGRELRRMTRSRFYLMFLFVLPLTSFTVLYSTFYKGVPRDLPVVVYDGDDSTLSRQIIRMLDATPALAVAASVHDPKEGAAAIRTGRAYAMVYMPEDLERDAKRGDSPAVTAYVNNQWLLTSSVVSRAVRDVVGTVSAGTDMRMRVARGEYPSQAKETYEPIRVDQHLLFNPNLNYMYFLLPALFPTMIQAFVLMMAVWVVGTELKHGTAKEWLRVSGNRPLIALLGKLAPHTVCYFVLTCFSVVLLVRFLGVPMNGSPWVLALASLLFVLAYQAVGVLLVVFTANLRLASSLSGFYAGPAFAVAGVTYPAIAMPLGAKVWSWSIPLSHYLQVLLQQTLRGAPPQASAYHLGVMALFAFAIPLLTLPRLSQVMRDAKFWGRS
ncbi:MAG: ABC transporter permease [Candidatus Hydrogenedentes bacterium]|nr:ABC transporter permease [Candidatus Hydrogenedentota bacterium]